MRVLVATDRIGVLSSAQAGAALATGWPAAEVTVLPIGEAGRGFVDAYATLLGAQSEPLVVADELIELASVGGTRVLGLQPVHLGEPDRYRRSSVGLGAALATVLASGPAEQVVLDLAGPHAHDAGAGLLKALGATADVSLDRGVLGLARLSELDLGPARRQLGTAELVGVVPESELELPLLGLRGITARRGKAAGEDTAQLLAVDASLEALARLAASEYAAATGAGACGGLGFGVLALGGRLTSGPRLALGTWGGPSTRLDLAVTGCSTFDFATRGGGVVAAISRMAAEALCPCIAFAGEVLIGRRELRTLGIESAYPVDGGRPGGETVDFGVDELAALARRVGRSWSW